MNKQASNKKIWCITGVSSGFGQALAETLMKNCYFVIGTVRKDKQKEEFDKKFQGIGMAVILDVTDEQAVNEGVQAAIQVKGRIDVLVNNAGYSIMGAVEELSNEEVKKQYETNVFGLLNVTRAILPQFRKQQSGHILNFSSVGGLMGSPGMSAYCGSKFAVEGISEALAQEVKSFGIKVTIVEPGNFRTNWAGGSMMKAEKQLDDYKATSGKIINAFEAINGKQMGNPALAAEVLIKVVNSENPPLHLPLGADCIEWYQMKRDAFQKDIEAWKDTAGKTAFSDYMPLDIST